MLYTFLTTNMFTGRMRGADPWIRNLMNPRVIFCFLWNKS